MKMTVEVVLDLLLMSGARQYGGEKVSQLEHALQAALLAEGEGAEDALIIAALLHDIGHLIAKTAGEIVREADDRHEQIGAGILTPMFSRSVTEPIRLHVEAKRYLCAAEPGYFDMLSPASVRSLELQGGMFSPAQASQFGKAPFADDAILLRRWDDMAKEPDAETRPLAEYEALLRRSAL